MANTPIPSELNFLKHAWPNFDQVDVGGSSPVEKELSRNATGSISHVVYGEVRAASVLRALKLVHAKPGERYYDLGSGAGKTAAIAWLSGLRATGVELIPRRHTHACTALTRLPLERPPTASSELSFVHSSFLDIDFCDADIVFIDAVMFSSELLNNLADRATCLRKGARLIWVGLKSFSRTQKVKRSEEYSTTRHVYDILASWGKTQFGTQEKLTESSERSPSQRLLMDFPPDVRCKLGGS